MADNKVEGRIVSKNMRYKNSETGDFVVVFLVENARDRVRFSKEGIGSGREYELSIEDFLKAHEEAPIDGKERQSTKREEKK